jgi:hypothetical protein
MTRPAATRSDRWGQASTTPPHRGCGNTSSHRILSGKCKRVTAPPIRHTASPAKECWKSTQRLIPRCTGGGRIELKSREHHFFVTKGLELNAKEAQRRRWVAGALVLPKFLSVSSIHTRTTRPVSLREYR